MKSLLHWVNMHAYLEKVEIDLFSVSVFLFMHRHKKVLHIHHHPQQSVNFIL